MFEISQTYKYIAPYFSITITAFINKYITVMTEMLRISILISTQAVSLVATKANSSCNVNTRVHYIRDHYIRIVSCGMAW